MWLLRHRQTPLVLLLVRKGPQQVCKRAAHRALRWRGPEHKEQATCWGGRQLLRKPLPVQRQELCVGSL